MRLTKKREEWIREKVERSVEWGYEKVLLAEVDALRKVVKRWEDEEIHEAMSCCVNNLELVALREERDQLLAELAKYHDVPLLERVTEERDRYRQALERIVEADRTISGMGSTAGDNKTWWIYGRFGTIAKEALKVV